jgi:RecB family exonuclease
MRVSASRLATWMTCPLQAKFRYLDRLPTKQSGKASFGTCIHAALDYYNTHHNVETAVALFKDYWSHPEKLGVEPEYWPRYATFGGLMSTGIELLRDYDAKLKWEDREVIGTEHKFLVPFGKHEITGFVDLVEVKRNKKGDATLRIVDYKTNAKAPYVASLKLNIQFTSYVYASLQPEFWLGNGPDFPGFPNGDELWDRFGPDRPRRAIWFQLMQNKEYDAGPRDDADFLRMYRVCHEIERAIEHNVFVPNISGDSCVWCDYTKPCGLPYKPSDPEEDQWF